MAKGSGELVWHKHDNEDELFIVFKGQLTLQLRSGDIVLNTGETQSELTVSADKQEWI